MNPTIFSVKVQGLLKKAKVSEKGLELIKIQELSLIGAFDQFSDDDGHTTYNEFLFSTSSCQFFYRTTKKNDKQHTICDRR